VIAPLALLMAALGALEFWLVPAPHLAPGAFALGGLLGCVLLVVVSKALGRAWLQRPDDDR
jgi:hypothetical protein